ncbi:hypothetical protein GCM10009765_77470 [Fodinicola feengrottensis]|uniref:PemK-like, MazF-like toxin of type II toxin-antitoxin system n=1 Tax=Fodinicola feengrottensis TaxID=435914 RepID=A0ABN2J3V7_9ACTN
MNALSADDLWSPILALLCEAACVTVVIVGVTAACLLGVRTSRSRPNRFAAPRRPPPVGPPHQRRAPTAYVDSAATVWPPTKPVHEPDEWEVIGPDPGEIWWAEVPFADGSGSKRRPCLVLRTYRGSADVLKITSQDKSHRSDHIQIPTQAWDPRASSDSWLELFTTYRVDQSAFDKVVASCDDNVWAYVTDHHRTGRMS